MSDGASWGWSVLLFLGAYHGVNPAMGWLFAVARGMQEKSARAVAGSLTPIALGHATAIGVVLLLARLVEIVLPLRAIRFAVAGALVALGLYRIVRNRHFAWGGMRVVFWDLTIWSFLMASAHGAGLMVLAVVMTGAPAGGHQAHSITLQNPLTAVWVTRVHTLGYLAITAAVALVVYQKLGLALLRTAWFNLDRVWAVALMATGGLTLLM